MSVSVFIGKREPEIGIVQWFRNPKFPNSYIEYPCGPLIALSREEFRSEGFQLVEKHFRNYEKMRLGEKDAIPVFAKGEDRKFLRQRKAIFIFLDDEGSLIFEPARPRRLNLGGFVSLGKDYRHTTVWPCTSQEFWACLDAALTDA